MQNMLTIIETLREVYAGKNVDARKTRDFANLTQNSSTVILSIYNVVLSLPKLLYAFRTP